jgi:hypothetical protein
MACASPGSRIDDLVDRTGVAKVDHLAADRLQDAPHDVDDAS